MLKAIKDRNSVLRITLNLTVASLISGTVLAGTFFFTRPYAEKQRVRLKEQSMRELVPEASSFKAVGGKDGWFVAENGNGQLGYLLPSEGKGYGGTIKLLIAVGTNARIIGYKVLSHNETPGLGDRAALSPFKDQFKNKTVTDLEVVKNHDTNRIDAITGATITSRAVTKAVREALERFGDLRKKP